MIVMEILFIMLTFIIAYLMREIFKIRKRLVNLIQENAVIWQFIREQEDK